VKRALAVLGAALALGGCASMQPKVDIADTQPVRPVVQAAPAVNNGAIFQGTSYRPLFEDHRARLVGDTITVQIVEKVSASQKSTSTVDKTGTVSAGISALPFVKPSALTRSSADANSANSFSGKGSTENSNDFSGTITAIGIEVIVSSGNICAAVYSPTNGTGYRDGLGRDAKPGVRKATTGSIACPASGYRELSLGGSVDIEAGDWLGFSADNTTATFIMIDDGGGGLVSNTFKGLRYYRGVFTLPDPATPDAAAMLRFPFAVGVP